MSFARMFNTTTDQPSTSAPSSDLPLNSNTIAMLIVGGAALLACLAIILACLKRSCRTSCRETLSNAAVNLIACVTCQQECCCCGKDRSEYETIPSAFANSV